jgi:hypothetical protein
MNNTELAVAPQNQIAQSDSFTSAFSSEKSFESAQRMAKALVSSKLVPVTYQGMENIGSAVIALEISQRLQCSVLMVMQNLHIIEGRPSWSSQFVIASINSCGRFSPLRFDIVDLGPSKFTVEKTWWDKASNSKKTTTKSYDLPKNLSFVAWCYDKRGERLESPAVTYEMACREGWWDKTGSKWQTIPELMGRYRSAAFLGRLYAPDLLMGMQTVEEVIDIGAVEVVNTPKRPIFTKPELPEKTVDPVEKLHLENPPQSSSDHDLPIEQRPEAPWDGPGAGTQPLEEVPKSTPQQEIVLKLRKEGYSEPDFFAALKSLDQKTTARTVTGLSDVLANGILKDWDVLTEALVKLSA